MVRGQFGHQMLKLMDAGSMLDVRRHGAVLLAPENISDESSEAGSRARFDEHPDPVSMHVFDGLAESYGGRPLNGGQFADLFWIGWELLRRHTRICGDPRRCDAHRFEMLPQPIRKGGKQ